MAILFVDMLLVHHIYNIFHLLCHKQLGYGMAAFCYTDEEGWYLGVESSMIYQDNAHFNTINTVVLFDDCQKDKRLLWLCKK